MSMGLGDGCSSGPSVRGSGVGPGPRATFLMWTCILTRGIPVLRLSHGELWGLAVWTIGGFATVVAFRLADNGELRL